jgi:hypothetical protein
MGVLDEAIRDHLELRRRHGASDAELARAEAEALGPARRDPAAGIFTDEEPAPGDDETTILDPVVADDLQPTLQDTPAPIERPADTNGETAVYEFPGRIERAPAAETPVEEPPVEEPPVEEPPVEAPPVEDEPPVEDQPPGDEEPPFEDSPPAGEHRGDPRDES